MAIVSAKIAKFWVGRIRAYSPAGTSSRGRKSQQAFSGCTTSVGTTSDRSASAILAPKRGSLRASSSRESFFWTQPYERRGACEGRDIASGEDRPASFDLKLCVLPLIFSNNRSGDSAVIERSDQAPFSANLGSDFLGKSFPTGILDEDWHHPSGIPQGSLREWERPYLACLGPERVVRTEAEKTESASPPRNVKK